MGGRTETLVNSGQSKSSVNNVAGCKLRVAGIKPVTRIPKLATVPELETKKQKRWRE